MNLGSKSIKNPKPLSESDLLRDEKIRMILHIVCTSEAPLSSTQIANKMKTKFDYDSVYIYKLMEKLSPIWDFYSYSDYKYRYPRPIRFLNFTSKEKTNKDAVKAKGDFEIARIECEDAKKDYNRGEISREELELEKNLTEKEKYYFRKLRRDYKYYPSLRTLLLYLYNEYRAKSTRKVDRIRKVLSNPRIIEIAPFLKYWKDFEEDGFDVVDILMETGQELRRQLHIKAENDTYLLRRITERIFSEIEIYLQFSLEQPVSLFFIKKKGLEKYNELVQRRNEYEKNIVALKRMWIAEELKEITFYETKHKEFDFEQEIHKIIRNVIDDHNLVINIEEAAQRYEISTYDALNLLLPPRPHDYYSSDKPYYYKYRGKRYLITNSCLILDSKTEDLKSLLIEGNKNKTITRYSQASTLFASNGIPKDCRSELIKRLGFYFIRENERGEYDSSDPLIVQKSVYAFKDFFDSIEYYPLVRQNFD